MSFTLGGEHAMSVRKMSAKVMGEPANIKIDPVARVSLCRCAACQPFSEHY